MIALGLGEFLHSTIHKAEMVEPVQSLGGQQEQLLATLHATNGNQVADNGVANARLTIVGANGNASHFGHTILKFMGAPQP